jgi:phospholipid/cholesterol/gamma-HCH transport system permease protein
MGENGLKSVGRHRIPAADDRATLLDERGGLVLHISGDWTLDRTLSDPTPILAALDGVPPPLRLAVDARDLGRWDSALVVFMDTVRTACAKRGIELDITSLPAGIVRLTDLANAVPERENTRKDSVVRPFVDRIGQSVLRDLEAGGEQIAFLGEVTLAFGRLLRRRAVFQRADVLLFMRACGPQALGITGVINLLIGMILAFIGAVQLRKFGAGIYVADLVGLAVTREMAAG